MELSTPLGLVLGFGSLILAFILEGGSLGGLWEYTALMIVLGGTFGALLVSYKLEDVLAIPKLISIAFKNKPVDLEDLISTIVSFAETARREGLLALESLVESEDSDFEPMLKKGIRLVVDGTDPELVKNFLELEVYMNDQKTKANAGIFETAGGFSPTMGIIGTVMGLVKVLANLSNPDELGPAVSVAFVATLYGVGFANLFWLPIGNKVKNFAKIERIQQMLIIEGILSIQSGENPRLIQEKLTTFMIAQTKAAKPKEKEIEETNEE